MTPPDRQVGPEQKKCSGCGLVKPRGQFYVRQAGKLKLDGTKPLCLSAKCKTCMYLETRARHQASFEAVNKIKMERGCTDCGYNAHPAALQFDHLPQFVKSFNISQGCTTKSLTNILAEIEKCEVVCANCHAIRTQERGAKVVKIDDAA